MLMSTARKIEIAQDEFRMYQEELKFLKFLKTCIDKEVDIGSWKFTKWMLEFEGGRA